MIPSADWIAELNILLERLIEGGFTPDDRSRLNALLAQGEEPRRYYRGYMRLHHGLEWRVGEPSFQKFSVPPARLSLANFAGIWSGGINYLNDHPMVLSNIAATVIVGIVILVAALTPKSHYFQMPGMARNDPATRPAYPASASPAPKPGNSGPEIVSVAQITGKVDCVWADDSTAPIWHKIELHDKFNLKSGLVEITYYSGAKVILQGPCTYEVDSAAGGFLSLGKLTARVENKGAGDKGERGEGEAVASGQWLVASDKGERGEGRGESAKPQAAKTQDPNPKTENQNPKIPKSQNPSSLPTSHYPLFTVKTPTAVVTDLGTEFGVEVDELARTETRVFRGKVKLAVLVADGKQTGEGREVVLGENESVAVDFTGSEGSLMLSEVQHHNTTKQATFIRSLKQFADERVISVNFTYGNTSDLAPNERTGVLRAAHWNNVDAMSNPPPVVALHNSAGEATTARLTWHWSEEKIKDRAWHQFHAPVYPWEKLLNGTFAGNGFAKLTIHIDSVPYANYRAYVYYWLVPSDDPKHVHKFSFSLNGGEPVAISRPKCYLNYFYPYRSESESGNYRKFDGLSGDLALIATPAPFDYSRGSAGGKIIFIAGLQIVDGPTKTTEESKQGKVKRSDKLN